MNDAPADHGSPAAASAVAASSATQSVWLRILLICVGVTGAVLIVLAAILWAASGTAAALSGLLGGAIVMLFFGISLLIGHLIGRRNPSGAMGMFVVTYVIKVIGFAAVMITLGMPAWLDRMWFGIAAIITVVLWQGAEIFVFSRARHQIYEDPPSDASSGQKTGNTDGAQA